MDAPFDDEGMDQAPDARTAGTTKATTGMADAIARAA